MAKKKKAAAGKATRRPYEYDHEYGLSLSGKSTTKKAKTPKR
jgi:hypothetical protein